MNLDLLITIFTVWGLITFYLIIVLSIGEQSHFQKLESLTRYFMYYYFITINFFLICFSFVKNFEAFSWILIINLLSVFIMFAFSLFRWIIIRALYRYFSLKYIFYVIECLLFLMAITLGYTLIEISYDSNMCNHIVNNIHRFLFKCNVVSIYSLLYISLYVLITKYFIFKLQNHFVMFYLHVLLALFKFGYDVISVDGLDAISKTYSYSFGENIKDVIHYIFVIDWLSFSFTYLSTIIMLACAISLWDSEEKDALKLNILLFYLYLFLIITFTTDNIFIFFIFFECTLIPMYLIVGVYGKTDTKKKAGLWLIIFTLFGSFCLAFGLLAIYQEYGINSLMKLRDIHFTPQFQCAIWIWFFIAFSCKIPLVPFHLWLPVVHVEAPTEGSVVLAAILLKLGIYGYCRFNWALLPEACTENYPLVIGVALVGIILASLLTLLQRDLKRIIAYSSIAHMSLVMVAFSPSDFSTQGIAAAVFQSLSHGYASAGLFFLIGFMYKRIHSRLISDYVGLMKVAPLFAIYFMLFTLANTAIPLSANFIGEFLLLVTLFKFNKVACIIAGVSIILVAVYSLWLFARTFSGTYVHNTNKAVSDLTKKELLIMNILLCHSVILGILPIIIMLSK